VTIYEFRNDAIQRITETTFTSAGVYERSDLQRLLRDHIDVISPDTLVIAEEFGQWEESRRRIDLLGLHKDGHLVVIELKRTDDGGHMELQAIRYAAMVSTMTFDQAVSEFGRYLQRTGRDDEDPRATMLEFLEWDEPDEDDFAQDVRIILASAEFSKELTSSVMWLNAHDLDVRCVRLKPYDLEGRMLVDVQQIVPLPEAADYQVQVKEKARKERKARDGGPDFTRFDVVVDGQSFSTMWKRNAIFVVCKHLCDNAVDPAEITRLFDWRPNRVWFSVEGEVDSSAFAPLATKNAAANGTVFRAKRWHCEEGELVHANGRTYAFSNQWGGPNWFRAMNALREHYPQFGIDYQPTG